MRSDRRVLSFVESALQRKAWALSQARATRTRVVSFSSSSSAVTTSHPTTTTATKTSATMMGQIKNLQSFSSVAARQHELTWTADDDHDTFYDRPRERHPRHVSSAFAAPPVLSMSTASQTIADEASYVATSPSITTTTTEHHKHCKTCTCEESHDDTSSTSPFVTVRKHSSLHPDDEYTIPLPPPLPEPQISVRRRLLPERLTALNSTKGRLYLLQALQQGTAASYIRLTEHFCNQSDPAFCGVTTLLMVLNALAVDPNVRWKGGWRYFGTESVLLGNCCLPEVVVQRVGITMEQFRQLAACHGVVITMKRPSGTEQGHSLEDFRRDVQTLLTENTDSEVDHDDNKNLNNSSQGVLVVSFSRAALAQTGDGHFSPIAAYHAESDHVLVMDVARFKYQPYWVSLSDLYDAMCRIDKTTGQSRGWYSMKPPVASASYKGLDIETEDVRPAALVPLVGQAPLCPVHPLKVGYCKAVRPPLERHHTQHTHVKSNSSSSKTTTTANGAGAV